MVAATYILLLLGVLGALDIAFYHAVSHGIRSHPDARHELIVHSLRGPTYATLFVVVPNIVCGGALFWLLIAVYVIDLVISIVDFWLERRSRAFLGGLPSGEYVLHILIAMAFGALVAATFYEGYGWTLEPTGFVYRPAPVPALVRVVMAAMAVVVMYSAVLDLVAVARMRGVPDRAVNES